MEYVNEIDEIGLDLERVLALLQIVSEMFEAVPQVDDEQKGWKLEVFCQRQDLFDALLDSVFDKVKHAYEKNQQVGKDMFQQKKQNKSEVA